MSGKSRSGRPLSVDASERILEASIALLEERGFDRLSVAAVAARAGVGKATIYRRWSAKEEIVIAALQRFVDEIRIPDSGSLRSDLLSLLDDAARVYRSPRARLLPALAMAMERYPRLAEVVRAEFFEPRRRVVLAVLERARDRGELPPESDLDLIHDLLVGPFVYRRLFTGGRIDRRLVHGITSTISELSLRRVPLEDERKDGSDD